MFFRYVVLANLLVWNIWTTGDKYQKLKRKRCSRTGLPVGWQQNRITGRRTQEFLERLYLTDGFRTITQLKISLVRSIWVLTHFRHSSVQAAVIGSWHRIKSERFYTYHIVCATKNKHEINSAFFFCTTHSNIKVGLRSARTRSCEKQTL